MSPRHTRSRTHTIGGDLVRGEPPPPPVSGNLTSTRGRRSRAAGQKGGAEGRKRRKRRGTRPVGRTDVLRRKIENVVLRDVVTEAAKQISPVKKAGWPPRAVETPVRRATRSRWHGRKRGERAAEERREKGGLKAGARRVLHKGAPRMTGTSFGKFRGHAKNSCSRYGQRWTRGFKNFTCAGEISSSNQRR